MVLRAFTAADAPLIAEASTDPLIPLITTVPASPDPTSVQAFIERQHERATSGTGYSFAIADASTDTGLGQIGLWPLGDERASVGYWVAPSFRRRGIASRSLALISEWGLGIAGLARLELYIEPWNERSWRTAEQVGYQREGLLRSWQQVGDQRRDMYMYSLVAAS